MWRDVWYEILKLKSQKKNYIVVVGQLFLIGLVYLGIRVSRFERMLNYSFRGTGLKIDDIIDAMFFARSVFIATLVIIMPIFICTIAGDMIAGEMQDGSLKLYASRPRTRTRILLSKIIAMYLFSSVYCIFFAILSFVAGLILFRWPGTQFIPLTGIGIEADFVIMSFPESAYRYVLGTLYHTFSVMALGSITLFFSCIFNRMTSATVAGMTVYFVCYVVEALPMLSGIKPYLLSWLMNGTRLLGMAEIPPHLFIQQTSFLAIYIILFSGLAIAIFNTKDLQ